MTTQVSELVRRISAAFPLAKIVVDPPLNDRGKHHVDVRLGDRLVVVEWAEHLGFGVSLVLEAALDGGPDFRLVEVDGAFGIVKLLLSEAQDAGFRQELGQWAAETAEVIQYEDLVVTSRDRRAPRRRAA